MPNYSYSALHRYIVTSCVLSYLRHSLKDMVFPSIGTSLVIQIIQNICYGLSSSIAQNHHHAVFACSPIISDSVSWFNFMVGSGDPTFLYFFFSLSSLSPFPCQIFGVGAHYKIDIFFPCVVFIQQQRSRAVIPSRPAVSFNIDSWPCLKANLYSQPAVQILRRKFAFSDFISSTIFFFYLWADFFLLWAEEAHENELRLSLCLVVTAM